MWELDYTESRALNNWYFWTAVLEKTLESPLDCKEIQPVYPKGNQSWIFIGKADAEAETLKNWLIWKDPDAGKNWRWEEKGMTEDEMVGWHHRLDGHEFEQALRVGDGQGSLACCSPWGHKELDTTEWLNWTERYIIRTSREKNKIDTQEYFSLFTWEIVSTWKSQWFYQRSINIFLLESLITSRMFRCLRLLNKLIL